jgi:hypothetical protein
MKADKPTTEDINRLKAWIEANNYKVYTIIRHVARSGMMREISVVIPITDDHHNTRFVHPSYTIAGLLGWSYTDKHGNNAVIVGGCGMDMGFHLVYSLSSVLYGDGYKIKQEWI